MLSQTRRALEDFDNQHDFERMAADVLNALGYRAVEPMAPSGGADGGRDIAFREGETPGIAFVTLDKKIQPKFQRDLAKHGDNEGVIALFCNVDVSPAMKLTFARQAIDKGYRLDVFDLERLRSLFDTSLKELRRRYLGIDDDVATRLRSEVTKLLRFPDAVRDEAPPPTTMEGLLLDTVPRKMFDLLMRYEERDVLEIPGIGPGLHKHLTAYYGFRQKALRVEEDLTSKIGGMINVVFRQAWSIYFRYALLRFAGLSKDAVIASGNFLNYGITWDAAEGIFSQLSNDPNTASEMHQLFSLHASLRNDLDKLLARP